MRIGIIKSSFMRKEAISLDILITPTKDDCETIKYFRI